MKKPKRWIFLGAAFILAAAAVAGGFSLRTSRRKSPVSLVYIPKIIDETNDFWTALLSGAQTAAEEYGAGLELMAPESETDYEGQNRYIREILDRKNKPDALLISPASYTKSTELLKEVKAAGIRLVMIDSSVDEAVEDLRVSTDNLEAGKKLGQFAADLLEEGKQVAVVGHVEGSSTAIEREKGFREGLGEKMDAFTEVVFCGSQYQKAYDLAVELMEKYPDLGVIAGLNEYSAMGAARAVRDASAQDRISMVGIDSSQEGISLMEQGVFKGIVIQKPFKMGYLGVKYTVGLLEGDKIEQHVNAGSELVTLSNMYSRENEKLLFPFNEKQDES